MAYKCSTEKKMNRVLGGAMILAGLAVIPFSIKAFPLMAASYIFIALGAFMLGMAFYKAPPSEDCLTK